MVWKNASFASRQRRTQAVTDCRARRTILIKRLAGGKCEICGYCRCLRALEFHHVNRSDKLFAISRKGHTRTLEKAMEETAKCVLLCANCHREVEDGITEIPSTLLARIVGSRKPAAQLNLF